MTTHKWSDIKHKMKPSTVARAEKRAKEMFIDIDVKDTLATLKLAKKQLIHLANSLPDDDNYATAYSAIMDMAMDIDACFMPYDGIKDEIKMARADAKKDPTPMANHAKGYYNDKLPIGFEYSATARASLRERAKEATVELRRRTAKDNELKKNVEAVMAEDKKNK